MESTPCAGDAPPPFSQHDPRHPDAANEEECHEAITIKVGVIAEQTGPHPNEADVPRPVEFASMRAAG
jgi:hypothetical protein